MLRKPITVTALYCCARISLTVLLYKIRSRAFTARDIALVKNIIFRIRPYRYLRDMPRSSFFFILAALTVILSGSDIVVVKANKVSCSCTKSNSNKVVTKTTECKAGVSKTECCTKAAKAWPSIKHCKYGAAATPELGSGAGQTSSQCSTTCNAAAGSQCVEMSGGKVTNPMCTCNTAYDCTFNSQLTPAQLSNIVSCGEYPHQAPDTYKGNVCLFTGKN